MSNLLPILTKEELNKLLQDFVSKLKALLGDHLRDVILYGSYARGEAEEGSDVDIMILVDLPEAEIHKYHDAISDYSTDFAFDTSIIISPIMHNKILFNKRKEILPFYQNVVKEGVNFYATK